MKLILASQSPFRKELLGRLGYPFETFSPPVDEDKHKSSISDPYELATTLARLKAQSFKNSHESVVIGSDQVSIYKGQVLGKPGTVDKAIEQLRLVNGKRHELVTAVCIIAEDRLYEWSNISKLTMKNLTEAQIRHYVESERPLQCAGSYKLESMGIGLFEKVETSDYTSIIGLPLIEVSNILNKYQKIFSSAK